jgi:hypothetical protein
MSQEVANVKKFVSGIKSKPLTQPKNKKKKKKADNKPMSGGTTIIRREDEVYDGEVVERKMAGAIEKEPEIYDAEIVEPKALTRGQRQITRGQGQITSGPKALPAPRSRQFDGL